MNKVLVLSGMMLLAASCSSSSGGGDNPGPVSYYATYELEDTCSTGPQSFRASSEDDIANAFCTGLKDNSLNQGCALFQRQELYKSLECKGAWPYAAPTGVNSTSSKQYGYQVNGCSTGLHAFASTTEEGMLRLYCKALLDNDFNQSCAKSNRDQAYADADCEKYL